MSVLLADFQAAASTTLNMEFKRKAQALAGGFEMAGSSRFAGVEVVWQVAWIFYEWMFLGARRLSTLAKRRRCSSRRHTRFGL